MKLESYNRFWQRIHKSAKDKGFPLRVMFELTYRCNFHCKHCYVPQSYRNYNELKTKEVLSILNQLADIGCFYLGFTGGEPFIREDIIDILWYAKKLGFEIIIYTNGSLINEEIAEELVRLRPNKVDITIPAMVKENFEQITQMPGSHKKVFGAINFLYKRRVNLSFKSCILKENEDEIKDIQNFAHSLGVLHRLDDVLSPRLDGSREPYGFRGQLTEVVSRKSYVVSQKSEVRVEKNKLPDCQTAKLLNCSKETNYQLPITKDLFKCGVGISQAAITPLGELKMCLMIDYPKYKILNTSLRECWQRLKGLVNNIKPDENYKCNKCELQLYCKWCPAKAWLYNRTFTWCEMESRRWAKIRIQNHSLEEKIHSYREIDRKAQVR